MKRGQLWVRLAFFLVLIVLVISFYGYYVGFSGTGDVGERRVELIERGGVVENLLVPSLVEVDAFIGTSNREEFEVVNYNEMAVSVSCDFPPFQEGVPSSMCFTYDSDGQFVGQGAVSLPPGKKQVFFASVRPFDNFKFESSDSKTLINIREGVYSGEIEIKASAKEDEGKVSVVSVPVKINVFEN